MAFLYVRQLHLLTLSSGPQPDTSSEWRTPVWIRSTSFTPHSLCSRVFMWHLVANARKLLSWYFLFHRTSLELTILLYISWAREKPQRKEAYKPEGHKTERQDHQEILLSGQVARASYDQGSQGDRKSAPVCTRTRASQSRGDTPALGCLSQRPDIWNFTDVKTDLKGQRTK